MVGFARSKAPFTPTTRPNTATKPRSTSFAQRRFSQPPTGEPSFYVGIELSESLYGKTVDLTKPIVKSGTLAPYLDIVAANEGQSFEIDNSEGSIDISVGEADTSLTVTSGTLKVTKNGGDFSVKLSVKLSDGKSIFADWTGKATKVTIPE